MRGGRRRNEHREKVNLISPGKLDSPAFCNSCFRAAASMGETERVRREREKKKGRKEGWWGAGGRVGRGEKGKTNPCRGRAEGEREAAARSPTGRQQSINQ